MSTPEPDVDALREKLRSLGYLDAGVDRFVLAPARAGRSVWDIASRSSLRIAILAGLLLGLSGALAAGVRVPGLVTGLRDTFVLATMLAVVLGAAVGAVALVVILVAARAIRWFGPRTDSRGARPPALPRRRRQRRSRLPRVSHIVVESDGCGPRRAVVVGDAAGAGGGRGGQPAARPRHDDDHAGRHDERDARGGHDAEDAPVDARQRGAWWPWPRPPPSRRSRSHPERPQTEAPRRRRSPWSPPAPGRRVRAWTATTQGSERSTSPTTGRGRPSCHVQQHAAPERRPRARVDDDRDGAAGRAPRRDGARGAASGGPRRAVAYRRCRGSRWRRRWRGHGPAAPDAPAINTGAIRREKTFWEVAARSRTAHGRGQLVDELAGPRRGRRRADRARGAALAGWRNAGGRDCPGVAVRPAPAGVARPLCAGDGDGGRCGSGDPSLSPARWRPRCARLRWWTRSSCVLFRALLRTRSTWRTVYLPGLDILGTKLRALAGQQSSTAVLVEERRSGAAVLRVAVRSDRGQRRPWASSARRVGRPTARSCCSWDTPGRSGAQSPAVLLPTWSRTTWTAAAQPARQAGPRDSREAGDPLNGDGRPRGAEGREPVRRRSHGAAVARRASQPGVVRRGGVAGHALTSRAAGQGRRSTRRSRAPRPSPTYGRRGSGPARAAGPERARRGDARSPAQPGVREMSGSAPDMAASPTSAAPRCRTGGAGVARLPATPAGGSAVRRRLRAVDARDALRLLASRRTRHADRAHRGRPRPPCGRDVARVDDSAGRTLASAADGDVGAASPTSTARCCPSCCASRSTRTCTTPCAS